MTRLARRRSVRSLSRRISLVAVLFATLPFVRPAIADDPADARLVLPNGSELVVVEDARRLGLVARFRGELWLRGRFVARWPERAANDRDALPEYILIPDAAGRAKLPYYELRENNRMLRYSPERIEIDATPDALRLAVGESQAQRLLRRRVDRVESRGRFLIGRYAVGVECDAPWATATLLEVDREKIVDSGSNAATESC